MALDALTGVKLWRLYFEKKQFQFMDVSISSGKSYLNICSLKECIKVDADSGSFEYILENAHLKFVSTLPVANDRYLAFVDSNFTVN